jgi:hypothetical protein
VPSRDLGLARQLELAHAPALPPFPEKIADRLGSRYVHGVKRYRKPAPASITSRVIDFAPPDADDAAMHRSS